MKSDGAERPGAGGGELSAIVWYCALAAILGIVYPTLAIATGPQQLAPNPNLASYPALIPSSLDFNTVHFDNFGVISVSGVAIFNRSGGEFDNLSGVLTIQQNGALINTDQGTNFYNWSGGIPTPNGRIINSDPGSKIVNQNSALFQNGTAFIPNDPATILKNQNGATFINTGGGTRLVNWSGATLTNTDPGTQFLNQNGAIFFNFGGAALINENGAVLINEGAGLVNGASIVNDSQIVNSNGGKFGVCGSASGAICGGGIGTVTGNGTYTQNDSGSVTNVAAGGSMTQSSITIAGGTLGGGGTINASTVTISNGAIVNPGLIPTDPNTLSINGTFILDDATLEINIAGTGAGQFDRLAINGGAFFTGVDSIIFDFIEGFAPNTGDVFEFLTASNIDLTGLLMPFNISYTGLAPGFQYTNVFDPGTNSFSLRADSPGVSTTPEPPTLLLLALGLIGFAAGRRKPVA